MYKLFFFVLTLLVPIFAYGYSMPNAKVMDAPYSEFVSVSFPDNWEEYRTDMKPVVTGLRLSGVKTIQGITYLDCEVIIDYVSLEFGEGIWVEGDSYKEIYFLENFYYPETVKDMIAISYCNISIINVGGGP